MKRIITTAVLILICFLLQSTVFQSIALAKVVPNLLLILTAAFGYMRGRTEGLFTGLVCGLLVDLTFGDMIGICAFIYMLIGYWNGLANKIYYKDDFTIPILLVGVSDFIYNFLYYVLTFLLRARLNFGYYTLRIIIPELVYTVFISVLLYKILHMINKKLELTESKEV